MGMKSGKLVAIKAVSSTVTGASFTGVTAIVPHAGNLFQQKVPAAVYVGNGFGKAAGFLQVRELGNLEIIVTSRQQSLEDAIAE